MTEKTTQSYFIYGLDGLFIGAVEIDVMAPAPPMSTLEAPIWEPGKCMFTTEGWKPVETGKEEDA